MSGSFEEIAELISESETEIPPLVMDALGQCLCNMDGMWEGLEEMTVGGTMSFLACVKGDKFKADQAVRDLLGFLTENMDSFIMAIRPGGADQGDAAETIAEGEKKMLAVAGKIKEMGPGLSPIGMFLASEVLMGIPQAWVAYVNELTSAAGMMAHGMPVGEAMYHRDLLSRLQEEKLMELMQRVDMCSLSYNSVPFRETEEWIRKAGPMFERLLSAGKPDGESMEAVVGKLGAPWFGAE